MPRIPCPHRVSNSYNQFRRIAEQYIHDRGGETARALIDGRIQYNGNTYNMEDNSQTLCYYWGECRLFYYIKVRDSNIAGVMTRDTHNHTTVYTSPATAATATLANTSGEYEIYDSGGGTFAPEPQHGTWYSTGAPEPQHNTWYNTGRTYGSASALQRSSRALNEQFLATVSRMLQEGQLKLTHRVNMIV